MFKDAIPHGLIFLIPHAAPASAALTSPDALTDDLEANTVSKFAVEEDESQPDMAEPQTARTQGTCGLVALSGDCPDSRPHPFSLHARCF